MPDSRRGSEIQMLAAFAAVRGVILGDLDDDIADLVVDLSATAPEHQTGYRAGFKVAIKEVRRLIDETKHSAAM